MTENEIINFDFFGDKVIGKFKKMATEELIEFECISDSSGVYDPGSIVTANKGYLIA